MNWGKLENKTKKIVTQQKNLLKKVKAWLVEFFFLRCDSLDKLRNKILQIENELTDANKFKDLYQFTFNFAKNPSQKSLDLEDAIAYWKMILSDRFKFLETWIKFLQVNKNFVFSS